MSDTHEGCSAAAYVSHFWPRAKRRSASEASGRTGNILAIAQLHRSQNGRRNHGMSAASLRDSIALDKGYKVGKPQPGLLQDCVPDAALRQHALVFPSPHSKAGYAKLVAKRLPAQAVALAVDHERVLTVFHVPRTIQKL